MEMNEYARRVEDIQNKRKVAQRRAETAKLNAAKA